MQRESLLSLFNKRFKQELDLPKAPLRWVNGKVEARLDDLCLASVLKPLALTENPRAIQGQNAALRAYLDGFSPFTLVDVYGEADDALQITLDRLCRTLHLLNYLPQAAAGGFLHLEVDASHVWRVKDEHGAYFEEVLSQCGLTPHQVAISVPFDQADASYQLSLVKGLNNYRRRGYRLGVKLTRAHGQYLQQATTLVKRLAPDFVKLDPLFLKSADGRAAPLAQLEQTRKLVSVAQSKGGQVIQEGVENEADLAVAAFVQAQLFEWNYVHQAAAQRLQAAA